MNARRQKLQLFIIRMYYTGKPSIWLFFFYLFDIINFFEVYSTSKRGTSNR